MEQQNHVFERIMQPHLDRLYRLAWRLTGSRSEAEDLFQELLLKAFGLLDKLVDVEQPGSWLARVMYNMFIDQRRRFAVERLRNVDEGHLPGEGLADLVSDLDPVADKERYDKLLWLDNGLRQLSDEHRQLLLLHDTEGYKIEEIHKITGIAVGTIKSRLHRARARLREILSTDGTFS